MKLSRFIAGAVSAAVLSFAPASFARTNAAISTARFALSALRGCEDSSQLKAVQQADKILSQIQADSQNFLRKSGQLYSQALCNSFNSTSLGMEVQAENKVLAGFDKVIASIKDLEDSKCFSALQQGKSQAKTQLDTVRSTINQKCTL